MKKQITSAEWLRQGFVLILIFSLFACSGKKIESVDTIKTNPEVKTGNPSHQKMVDYLTLNGNTVFLGYEVVRSAFSGYIDKVSKNIGDTIAAGENIFIIKTKEANIIDSSSDISPDIKFRV